MLRIVHTVVDERYQQLLYRNRLWWVTAFCLALVLVLISRYSYLQLIRHDYYSVYSEDNRIKMRSILPVRGLIYDRNGELLAENRPMPSLMLSPAEIPDLNDSLDRLDQLIDLQEVEIERFRRLLGQRGSNLQIPLRIDLTERELARLAAERHRLPGVHVRAQLVRHYPYGEQFAHVLGYTGAINHADRNYFNYQKYRGNEHVGKTGLERFYEKHLHGRPGSEQVEVNAQGSVQRVLHRDFGEAGKALFLNLDVRLQDLAVQSLAGRRGAIVGLDPHSGGVLTFVSAPSFNPNNFVLGFDRRKFSELLASPERPLFNRVTQGQYSPASTLKPMIALAGLYSRRLSPDFVFEDRGHYLLGQRVFNDWRPDGHGEVNLRDSLAVSCDTYYYYLSHRLGMKPITRFADFFGLGSVTGIDLPSESRGLFPNPEWKRRNRGETWYEGDTLNVGIGQGYVLTTPLQLAWFAAQLATDGVAPPPRLQRGEVGVRLRDESAPQVPAHMWRELRRGMEAATHDPHGTAYNIASGLDYRIASKTGTVQLVAMSRVREEQRRKTKLRSEWRDHSVYIGYAPAEDPQIAVAIVVENSGQGSRYAAPIARKLFDHWLASRHY